MQKIAVVFFMMLTPLATTASTAEPTAGSIYFDCLLARAGAIEKGNLCAFSIWGFAAGYAAGADRGASTALIYDEEAAYTVKGVADLRKRLGAIQNKARCIPQKFSARDLVNVYMGYMAGHPERTEKSFREVMADVVPLMYQCDINSK